MTMTDVFMHLIVNYFSLLYYTLIYYNLQILTLTVSVFGIIVQIKC